EYIERLKVPRRTNRSYGIAIAIHRRVVRCGILIVHAREEAENALPSKRREHRPNKSLFEDIPLFIDEDEEERLVLDDWPSQTRSELVSVLIIFGYAIKVVEPIRRIRAELWLAQKALPRT